LAVNANAVDPFQALEQLLDALVVVPRSVEPAQRCDPQLHRATPR
jgi:hypothetical protein